MRRGSKARRDRSVAKLETIQADLEATIASREADGACSQRADQAFHEAVIATARNPRIAQALRQAMSVRLLGQIFERYRPVDFPRSIAQHRTILDAIRAGDPDWATAAMSTHIRSAQF